MEKWRKLRDGSCICRKSDSRNPLHAANPDSTLPVVVRTVGVIALATRASAGP